MENRGVIIGLDRAVEDRVGVTKQYWVTRENLINEYENIILVGMNDKDQIQIR
ncbi:MAG: hypothetical protein ACQEQM_08965 [Thermoplasmatota archaeon]